MDDAVLRGCYLRKPANRHAQTSVAHRNAQRPVRKWGEGKPQQDFAHQANDVSPRRADWNIRVVENGERRTVETVHDDASLCAVRLDRSSDGDRCSSRLYLDESGRRRKCIENFIE